MQMRFRPLRLLRAPIDDYLAGLVAVQRAAGPWGFAAAALAAVASWWIYVPLHELAHAYGCIATGGEVSRLEIDAVYGAAWLQELFPFVAVGSDYAGQLTGFETHGNDLIYFATDAAPFLLTVAIGVPLLRLSPQWPLRPVARSCVFGAAIPWAFAPFVSLPGDYYEMGSLVVSRAYRWFAPDFPLERWRSDDLTLLAAHLWDSPDTTPADFAGVALAAALGALLCLATYQLGIAATHAFARLRAES